MEVYPIIFMNRKPRSFDSVVMLMIALEDPDM